MSLDINWWCVRFCKDNSNFCTSRDSHTTVKFVLHEIVRVQIMLFVTRDTPHCFRKENKRILQIYRIKYLLRRFATYGPFYN